MNTNAMVAMAGQSDAELVAQSLDGNREAFGQIVARYQSLLCSLAYSATGSLTQSEDLAQDTFLTAWKHLADLREPTKLSAWLCGIARNLTHNWLRRQGREPSLRAESLENISEIAAPEPLPIEQTISREEEAVLWHSIERIPEIYREPLVLYYREHQAIEFVAQALELSEDAVHQRLSRGRKLLQEQILAFVKGALERTRPDKAFTLGVLAALPLVVTTARAATVGVAVKGGSTVKALSSFATLGVVLTASVLFFFSLVGFLIFTGACIGYMMGRSFRRSTKEFNHALQFWRILASAFLGIVLPMWLLLESIPVPNLYHTWLTPITWVVALFYPIFLTALIVWIAQWWHCLRHPDAKNEPVGPVYKRRFAIWFTLGMLLPTFVSGGLLFSALFQSAWTTQDIPPAQAQVIINARKDAKITLDEYRSGLKQLWIKLPENARRLELFTKPDDATLALLANGGVKCQTRIEGRDFVQTGVAWHFLAMLSIFVTALGGTVLMQRPWKLSLRTTKTEIQRDERAAKMAFKAFATSIALVMLLVGGILGLLTIKISQFHNISSAQAQNMIADAGSKSAPFEKFEVYQYANGSRELWINRPLQPPSFIAPADAATLSLLEEKKVEYNTLIQGRDFGYNIPPNGVVGLLCTIALVGGAGVILWRVSPRVVALSVVLILMAACALLGFITPWHHRTISVADAQKMVAEHNAARFVIFQYSNGSRDLWIIPRPSRPVRFTSLRAYIAPATAPTLALLATNKISYSTMIQGRDFNFSNGLPARDISAFWISILSVIWVYLLCWVIKRPHWIFRRSS
ncbi:MAG TPA: RNA polymerase sigma factor [Alphaproteobacteria bacterium]|nr:RNA polymerase sigma factor [Alphaproteobacteria bacterium]